VILAYEEEGESVDVCEGVFEWAEVKDELNGDDAAF